MGLHRRAARHAVNGGLRLLAVVLALLALAVPAYAYWESTRPPGIELGEQIEVPLPESPETLPGGMPSYENGVIALSYHDISRKSDDAYAVTPRSFAAQMAALEEAGFETISLDEFNAHMAGEGELPERALLITFDDGTKSNWIYADPVLRRLGYEATNFLITADVSHHQPYYLLWEEVEAMQGSGRWSFGSHTDDGHGFVATSRRGEEGPFLTNRIWLARERRLETRAEYQRRISRDLDRSIARMEAHGLPRPTAFSYPFSAVEASNDPVVSSQLTAMLAERFADVFVNRTENTMIRRGTPNPISRVEVFHGTTTQSLLKQLRHTIEYGETGRHTAE